MAEMDRDVLGALVQEVFAQADGQVSDLLFWHGYAAVRWWCQ